MGADPWHYFTPYRADINAALQDLKEQEFRAGRYGFAYQFEQFNSTLQANTGTDIASAFPQFSGIIDQVINQPESSAEELIEEYGSVQAAMEAVLEESAPDGTQSILDMTHLSDQPEICAACPLSEDELQELFQTSKPTREMIEAILICEEDQEACETFWENIGRGEGRYIIAYQEGQPQEIFFAGYSFD